MNKIENAITTFYFLENKANQKNWINNLHPLSKVLISMSYICFVISFPKYAFFPLLAMCSYLFITLTLAHISFRRCLHQVRFLLILVCVIGIFNPLFDRTVILRLGPFLVTTGMISMLTLMLKGIFAVISSYILIATTPMEEICYALKCLRIPDLMTSTLLLSYRHLLLLLSELGHMSEAYHLRSVKQKGIHIKAWGSFIGYFLLRSMDKAEAISESMTLRGFHGNLTTTISHKPLLINILFITLWTILFLILRFVLPVM